MHSIVSRKDQLLSVFKGTYVQGWINEKCVLTEGSSLFYKRQKSTIFKNTFNAPDHQAKHQFIRQFNKYSRIIDANL